MTYSIRDLWSAFCWLVLLIPRGIRKIYRKITPEGARKARDLTLSLSAIFLVLNVFGLLRLANDIQTVTKDTNTNTENIEQLQIQGRVRGRTILEIAKAIEKATSPEAQERQEQIIDFIVEAVTCENQDTIQRLVDLLVEREVIEPGILMVLTEECAVIVDKTPVK